MFESLKKKIGSWFGSEEKEKSKKAKKEKRAGKIAKASGEIAKVAKEEKIARALKGKKGKKKDLAGKVAEAVKDVEQKLDAEEIKELKEYKKEVVEGNPVVKIEEKQDERREEKAEDKEEEKEGQGGGFFSRLFKKVTGGTATVTQEQFDEMFSELEMTLLENNVALEVVDKIRTDLAKDVVGLEVKKGKIDETILESLKNSILSVLIEPDDLVAKIKKSLRVYTIIFFGINGSGKTTSIAKLAYKLQQSGISCVLAAADTFRAASIAQLQKHGENLGVKVISSNYGADPTAVAFDAKKYAESNGIKVLLIDTAGRMYTKENLIREMEKIIRVIQPNLKIFVGESITGNDATEQAKAFNEAVGLDGIILSKADVDDKAGTVLSVSYVTGKPIYFLGVGQEYGDLKEFSKKDVLKSIGLG